MPLSDFYTAKSGSVTLASTSAVAVLSLYGSAASPAKRGFVIGIRAHVGNTTAAAGNDLLFQIARPGNTPTGTSLTSGNAHDFAAGSSFLTSSVTWSTTPTVGTVLYEQVVPQTTGSSWEEFPPPGAEWVVPAISNSSANTGIHVFVTPTVNTNTPVFIDLIWSE